MCYLIWLLVIIHFRVQRILSRRLVQFWKQKVINGMAPDLAKLGSTSTTELHPKSGAYIDSKAASMPPASVMTKLVETHWSHLVSSFFQV